MTLYSSLTLSHLVFSYTAKQDFCAVKQNRTDFLQMMLKAQHQGVDDTEGIGTEQQSLDTDHAGWNKKGLSKEEVLAQSMLFFLAGYETTASTLAFLAYCFALNPECQERAHAEVVQTLGDKVSLQNT